MGKVDAKKDSRYVFFFDDVIGANISSVKMVVPDDNREALKLKNSFNVVVDHAIYH